MLIDSVKSLVENEEFSWTKITALKERFSPDLTRQIFSEVPLNCRAYALSRGREIIMEGLKVLHEIDSLFPKIEPGHGVGHITRDYVNALRLFSKLETSPEDLMIGFVAGVFHDIGCAMIHRYYESQRVVRHAEVAALMLLEEVFPRMKLQLKEEEKIAIAYAVAAHTHYLKATIVECSDDVKREIIPYRDMDDNGQPVWWVWFPRWVDRLEVSGATFVGRHYLTRWQDHEDYNGKDFFSEVHEKYMLPVLRPREEQLATKSQRMIEHLHMFATSQTNDSPYGKHDFGQMAVLRDSHKEILLKIVAVIQQGGSFSKRQMRDIQKAWILFLGHNIEHSAIGLEAAQKLEHMFWGLDVQTQQHWTAGFLATMREYLKWSDEVVNFLDHLAGNGWSHLNPITPDVYGVICPDRKWVDLIAKI